MVDLSIAMLIYQRVPQLDGQYLTKIAGGPPVCHDTSKGKMTVTSSTVTRSGCEVLAIIHGLSGCVVSIRDGSFKLWIVLSWGILGLFKDTLNDPLEDYLKLAMVITLNGIVFLHGFLLMVIRRDQSVYLYDMCLMSIYFEHDYCLHLYICAPKSLESGNSKLP